MINRRSLRIKAFKNLYAYESCKRANYLMALDLIDETFSPDLNSMEIVDKADLERKRKLARNEFSEFVDATANQAKAFSKEFQAELKHAQQNLKAQNQKDLKRLIKDLLSEADKVLKEMLLVLSLLVEFADLNRRLTDDENLTANLLGEKVFALANLHHNQVIEKLRKDAHYNRLTQQLKCGWVNEEDTVQHWYKGTFGKDPTLKEYLKKESPIYEDDWFILDYICRTFIFKSDVFTSFFESLDLDWVDTKPVVRSLVLKTLKSVKEKDGALQLPDVSYNWEDDSEYVHQLFKKAVRNDDDFETLLMGKLENWDIKRVALTDRILLKMAIAEMVGFPSIPVKVTINEFIEISKTFSTPKSKKFVNGILDGIAIELVKEGVIKKSGRGLLDNK
jgi:N utilization substance protein B